MNGKLSWMTFAIIGGVIVSAVLIFIYFVLFKGMMFSMLATGAIKPFSNLIMGMDQLSHSDSAIVTEFKVDYHPAMIALFPDCVAVSEKAAVNGYADRNTMVNFNAILIFNSSEVYEIKNSNPLNLDSQSMYQISQCNNNYCYCAARISLDKGIGFKHKKVYDSGCTMIGPSLMQKLEILIPSIGTDFNLINCLNGKAHVRIFTCKEEKYPLVLDGKNIKVIEYFYTKNLFLIKQKNEDDNYFVDVKYVDPGDCDASSCVYITDSCPYESLHDGYDW